MNYIFFDVDGVLNGTDENGKFLDAEVHKDKVERLARLAKKTNAKIIMSSCWRNGWDNEGNIIKEKGHYFLIISLILLIQDALSILYFNFWVNSLKSLSFISQPEILLTCKNDFSLSMFISFCNKK